MKTPLSFLIIVIYIAIGLSPLSYADTEEENKEILLMKKAFSDGFYDLVINQANEFLKTYPAKTHLDEIHMLIGKSYFYKEKYSPALNEFETVLQFTDSRLRDGALYWSGEVNFKVKDYDRAISLYQRLIDKYPLSVFTHTIIAPAQFIHCEPF